MDEPDRLGQVDCCEPSRTERPLSVTMASYRFMAGEPMRTAPDARSWSMR